MATVLFCAASRSRLQQARPGINNTFEGIGRALQYTIYTSQEHQKDQRGKKFSEQLFKQWTCDTFSKTEKHKWVEEARKIANKEQEKH